MTVIQARVLGFCMGVRRAVEMAEEEASRKSGGVWTIGPLIHNPQVLDSLRNRGVRILEEGELPPDLGGMTVIIRAHGVSPALEDELLNRRAVLVDATCPRVKTNQLKARSLAEAGLFLFIAGEKQHGEVIGLMGYAPGARVVSDSEEAAAAATALRLKDPGVKTALIGQTTIGGGEYRVIADAILAVFPDLEIVDSICPATRERQEALRELCFQVDAVIVAGGRSSSNTRRLMDIPLSLGKSAWLAESAAEFIRENGAAAAGYRIIGLSAGASTPDSDIAGIEAALAGL
jgi:4-hydroxy-3-methylbut-2-enyl diphosphate reductase